MLLTLLIGKSTISMAIFNSYVNVYQRVYPINIPLNHYKIPLNHFKSNVFPMAYYVYQRVTSLISRSRPATGGLPHVRGTGPRNLDAGEGFVGHVPQKEILFV